MSRLQIVALLMENQPGALSRVVGLFSQRGFNIESLNVAPTQDPTLSRLTLSLHSSSPQQEEQVVKQLHKLVDVIRLVEFAEDAPRVERELMLVKVGANSPQERAEAHRAASVFRGQIVDMGTDAYTVQLTGPPAKLDAFLAALGHLSVLEVSRTGVVTVHRGTRALRL